MMASTKLDVLWSPIHHDKFVAWGSDITLYEVGPISEFETTKPSHIKISATLAASVVASQSGTGIRCMDISYLPQQEQPLLAFGHTSGRVTLASLGPSEDAMEFAGREFGPRYPRLCNSVSWCSSEPQLLAVALDKHRTEHSIVLWDVTRGYAATVASESESPARPATPIAEMCLSESVHSVAWSHAARTLLSANNCKHIKIFDCRDLSNKAVSVATTRYCYSPIADPFNEWQIASRGDGTLLVWDARKFEKPLVTLVHAQPLTKIQWCPSRRNVICALQRDSSSLRLHEIQQAQNAPASLKDKDDAQGVSNGGGGLWWRDVSPAGGQQLASFCWHRAHPQRLLALTHSGSAHDWVVLERCCVAWGAAGGAAWGAGGALRRAPDPAPASAPRDLAALIKARAQLNYGLKAELWQNAELAEDEAVAALWHFLSLSKSLVEDGCISLVNGRLPGVLAVVGAGAGGGYRSEASPALVPDLPDVTVTLYRSTERTRALQLCGWGWGWEQGGAVGGPGGERHAPRAAALAAFHLRLAAARDALARPPPAPTGATPSPPAPSHALAALALPPHPKSRFWRESVSAALGAVSEPYVRGLLHFLPALGDANPDFTPVLNETGMRLEDRVAFACIYLPDGRLRQYLQTTRDDLLGRGDLGAILLTGMSESGVRVIQRWLDRSGDVQTAALLAARCLPAPPAAPAAATPAPAAGNALHHAPLLWRDTYRELLNSWKMWWARCAFDSADPSSLARLPQVSVSCSYCGKAVSGGGRAAPRPPPAPPQHNMKQASCCGHCRKPLARCALCLGALGAGAGGAAWARWAAWCALCRHGGHAQHLRAWFKEHKECPVSSCNCHCNSLDPPDRP